MVAILNALSVFLNEKPTRLFIEQNPIPNIINVAKIVVIFEIKT